MRHIHILDLPEEVVVEIFTHLGPLFVISTGSIVNRAWADAAKSSLLWERFLLQGEPVVSIEEAERMAPDPSVAGSWRCGMMQCVRQSDLAWDPSWSTAELNLWAVESDGKVLHKVGRNGYMCTRRMLKPLTAPQRGVHRGSADDYVAVVPLKVHRFIPAPGLPRTYGPDPGGLEPITYDDSLDTNVYDSNMHIGFIPSSYSVNWLNTPSAVRVTQKRLREGDTIVLYYRPRDRMVWVVHRDQQQFMLRPRKLPFSDDPYVAVASRALDSKVEIVPVRSQDLAAQFRRPSAK